MANHALAPDHPYLAGAKPPVPALDGQGGLAARLEVDQQLQAQRAVNEQLEQRNAALDAEVRDLKSGNEAIEERARFELGLTRPGEVFVHTPK